MWVDGIGFSAPLVEPTTSKILKDIGFALMPPGLSLRVGRFFAWCEDR
jgi:hypothetical protein